MLLLIDVSVQLPSALRAPFSDSEAALRVIGEIALQEEELAAPGREVSFVARFQAEMSEFLGLQKTDFRNPLATPRPVLSAVLVRHVPTVQGRGHAAIL